MSSSFDNTRYSQSYNVSYRSSQQQLENIEHSCALPESINHLSHRAKGFCWKWLYSCLIISNKHPYTPKYFCSLSLQRNEIKQQVFNPHWFCIHPFSKLRLYYDIIMAPLSLLTIFIIIYINAFYDELYNWASYTEMVVILCAINIICIIDIFFNLFTGYYNGVEVVLNPINIAIHYLKKYLVADSITLLAFIYLASTIKNDSFVHLIFKNLALMKVLTIVRCFKQLSITLDYFQTSNISHRIIRLVIITFLLTHISGCIYKKSYQVAKLSC